MPPFIILFLLCSLLFPILGYFYADKKYALPRKPVVVGAVVWVIFTQVLEKGIHIAVLSFTPLIHFPLWFAFYGGLMAGIFEEGGRYVAFKKLLPHYRAWKDGVAYGIGHGGIESIIVGIALSTQTLLLADLEATGKLEQVKGKISEAAITNLLNAVHDPIYWVLGSTERICAVIIQIALSLLVLYALKTKKMRFFFLAILLHAAFDFPAGLYQAMVLNIWVVEGIITIAAFCAVVFIYKSKKLIT